MQISNIGTTQNFCSRKRNNTQKNEFYNFSDFLNSTTEKTAQIADLAVAVNTAIGSPEEATIKVLNDKLDNVAQNEKYPKWVRKPLTYIASGAFAISVYFAATKSMKTPRIAINYIKNHFGDKKVVTTLSNFASTVKEKASNVANVIRNKKAYKTIAEFLLNKFTALKNYSTQKMPKVTKCLKDIYTKLEFNKWGKKDYIRNLIAASIGLSSGKKYLDKHSVKNEKTKNIDYDAELNIKEAA